MTDKKAAECKKCGEILYIIKGLRTDRDGMREDRYCPGCHTRYGSRAHGLVVNDEKPVPGECKYKTRGCIFYEPYIKIIKIRTGKE